MATTCLQSNKPEFYMTGLPHQKILIGALGTGKSSTIKNAYAKGHKQVRVLFNADFDYTSFVGGYAKTLTGNSFTPEYFAKTYISAWSHPDKAHFIIIEGINRGDCSKIFGDLIQCFERNEDGYSTYSIGASTSFGDWITAEFSKNPLAQAMFAKASAYREEVGLEDYNKITLPPNLYIYCTMNTSDGLPYPMDSTFRRAWDWEYVAIDYYDANNFVINIDDGLYYSWGDFLQKLNQSIINIGNYILDSPKHKDVQICLKLFKNVRYS